MRTMDQDSLAAFLAEAAVKHTGPDWAARYSQDAVQAFGTNATTFLDLLETAAAAHHAYEKGLGHKDDQWAAWYASHMLAGSK